jgi:hypothetical protein
MKKRKLSLENLGDKGIIKFCSEGGRFNFKDSSLLIEIRFDNPGKTVHKFSADGWIMGRKNTNLIEVRIPAGAAKANVLLTSAWGTDDLGQIQVITTGLAA